jgi:hypothetical protein
MTRIEKIIVSIHLNEVEMAVGELVSDNKNIYFKYILLANLYKYLKCMYYNVWI